MMMFYNHIKFCIVSIAVQLFVDIVSCCVGLYDADS